MDAEEPLQENSMRSDAVDEIRNAETATRQKARTIGTSQYTVSQRQSVASSPLRHVPVNQPRKIELEFVSVAFGVRTLNLTQFALKAGIDDLAGIGGRDLPNIAVVLLVQ